MLYSTYYYNLCIGLHNHYMINMNPQKDNITNRTRYTIGISIGSLTIRAARTTWLTVIDWEGNNSCHKPYLNIHNEKSVTKIRTIIARGSCPAHTVEGCRIYTTTTYTISQMNDRYKNNYPYHIVKFKFLFWRIHFIVNKCGFRLHLITKYLSVS